MVKTKTVVETQDREKPISWKGLETQLKKINPNRGESKTTPYDSVGLFLDAFALVFKEMGAVVMRSLNLDGSGSKEYAVHRRLKDGDIVYEVGATGPLDLIRERSFFVMRHDSPNNRAYYLGEFTLE